MTVSSSSLVNFINSDVCAQRQAILDVGTK